MSHSIVRTFPFAGTSCENLEWPTKASSTLLLQFSYQAFWREVIGPEPDICEELIIGMYQSVRMCSH